MQRSILIFILSAALAASGCKEGTVSGNYLPPTPPGDSGGGGGDALPGDSPMGDPMAGDPVAGDPVAGDPVAGDPVAGDPVAGDPVAGDPVAGDPIPGDTMSGGDSPPNGAPVVTINFSASSYREINGGTTVSLSGAASDPDGDPMTYSWDVAAISDPTIDCSADWSVNMVDPLTMEVTAPTSASDPACADGVLVTLVADDGTDTGTAYATLVVLPDVTVSIWQAVLNVAVGNGLVVFASSTPDVSKTYAWTVESVSGGCVAGDLTFAAPPTGSVDTNTSSRRELSAALDGSLVGCRFVVRVTADVSGTFAFDEVIVVLTNAAPVLTIDGLTPSAPGAYSVTLPPGVTPSFTSRSCDTDNHDLTQTWGGDTTDLTCSPTCADGPTVPTVQCTTYPVTFAAPLVAATTYSFTIDATDGVDTTPITFEVVTEPCLWVDDDATAGGDGTLATPYDTIQAALDIAKASADTNVCVIEGTYNENLLIPSTPYAPDLLGGFYADGSMSAPRGEVFSDQADGARFESGYDGTVRALSFGQDPALSVTTGTAAAMTVDTASPVLEDLNITGREGETAVGLAITTNTGDPTNPRLRNSTVGGANNNTATAVFGISVDTGGGGTGLPLIGPGNMIVAGNGTNLGVAVRYSAGANISVNGNNRIAVCIAGGTGCGFATGIGVDVEGGALSGSSGTISGNGSISIGGSIPGRSAAIRLAGAQRVSITNNREVGRHWEGGAEAAFGIIDGWMDVDGSGRPGSSSLLTISNNDYITGGGQPGFSSCDGAHIAAGILLWGTSGVSIRDNGAGLPPSFRSPGIVGGIATTLWDPAADALPPHAPGLWTIGTSGMRARGNVISSGILSPPFTAGCPMTPRMPMLTSVQDGMRWTTPGPATSPSSGLILEKNGIICGIPAENAGAALLTRCTTVDLNAPTSVTLENNVIATVASNENTTLWIRQGSGVRVRHNTFDPDFILLGGPPPPPGSIRKWAIRVDSPGTSPGSATIELANNVVLLRRDDPYDDVTQRLALWERNLGAGSAIGVLSTTVMYAEGDDLSSTDAPPYLRLDDSSGRSEYDAANVNGWPSTGTVTGNLVADPALTDPGQRKELMRLTAGSAAIDTCDINRSLSDDIDDDARPSGSTCDAGSDEVVP